MESKYHAQINTNLTQKQHTYSPNNSITAARSAAIHLLFELHISAKPRQLGGPLGGAREGGDRPTGRNIFRRDFNQIFLFSADFRSISRSNIRFLKMVNWAYFGLFLGHFLVKQSQNTSQMLKLQDHQFGQFWVYFWIFYNFHLDPKIQQ